MKIRITTSFRHDFIDYSPGDELVEVSDEVAAVALANGCAVEDDHRPPLKTAVKPQPKTK